MGNLLNQSLCDIEDFQMETWGWGDSSAGKNGCSGALMAWA